jgi:hypothetical protein
MALKIRFPGSRDYSATAYWSGGTLPVDGDSIAMYEGADQIDQNLPAGTLSIVDFIRGPACRSGLGAEATPFAPTLTGKMILDGDLAPGRFDHLGAGASGVAKLLLRGSASRTILSSGTFAHLGSGRRGRALVTQGATLSGEVVTDHPEAYIEVEAKSGSRAALMKAVLGQIVSARGMNAARVVGSARGVGTLTLIDAADISDTGNSGLLELAGGIARILSNALDTPESAQIDGDVIADSGLLTGEGNTYGDVVVAGDITYTGAAEAVRRWSTGKLIVNGSELETGGSPEDFGV